MVMLGGAMGSLLRYVAGTAIMTRFGESFPLGTLLVNVTGSFLAGLVMTLLTEVVVAHPYWRLLVVVGFLGGYTTFSAFEYETYRAVRDGGGWLGLVNVVASVVMGYGAVWLGAALVRRG